MSIIRSALLRAGSGGGPWEFVTASAAQVITGSVQSLSIPSGYQAGDLLFLCGSASNINETETMTTGTGWTKQVDDQSTGGGGGVTIYSYWKIATSNSESNPVLTWTASVTTSSAILVYRNISSSPLDDATNRAASGTNTSRATPSMTTTLPNDLIISFLCISFGSGSITPPTATNIRVNTAGTVTTPGICVVDENQSAAGATTARVFTWVTSVRGDANAIAFKQA